ncbi:MAG: MFS transporter [Candidatus Eisenbacteria bacterium]
MTLRGRIQNLVDRTVLPRGLSAQERRLLGQHLLSSLFTGIVLGGMNLGDITLVKTLSGSALQVTTFNILVGASYLGSLFFVGMMRGRAKGPFVLASAMAGRLGLWLLPISRDPDWFIFVLGLAWFSHAMILIAQVSIIHRAYAPGHRNTLFGLSISMMTAMNLIASVLFGWLLEWNDRAYAIYYGLAGISGFLGALLLARMEREIDRLRTVPGGPTPGADAPARADWRGSGFGIADPAAPAYRPMGQPGLGATLRSMRESVELVLQILRTDTRYRRFQRNFFLYGIAFLSILPVVPLFLVHDLALNYHQIGIAKGLMGQAGMILFPPLLGRLMERLGPVRFSGRMFAFLSLYPLLLLGAGFAPPAARLPITYAAFLCFGICMAGVNLAWHMSSLHFAGDEDPSSYQAVHTVLTGLRGSFAPLLGYGLIQTGSKVSAFGFSAALLWVAAFLMGRMAGDEERGPRATGQG